MGHREDLLAAAKRCLKERGYAHITARDLVAESGTNLASIGYHFGSKEMLLNRALIEMSSEWGDELEPALQDSADASQESDPYRRFEALWSTVIDRMGGEGYWGDIGSEELLAQARRNPELRAVIADGFEQARHSLIGLYHGEDPPPPGSRVDRALGGLYFSLLLGLSIQWSIDPDRAPTAADLTAALRALVAVHTTEGSSDSP
jgi:AcrR family transcriptional regulator